MLFATSDPHQKGELTRHEKYEIEYENIARAVRHLFI